MLFKVIIYIEYYIHRKHNESAIKLRKVLSKLHHDIRHRRNLINIHITILGWSKVYLAISCHIGVIYTPTHYKARLLEYMNKYTFACSSPFFRRTRWTRPLRTAVSVKSWFDGGSIGVVNNKGVSVLHSNLRSWILLLARALLKGPGYVEAIINLHTGQDDAKNLLF